MYHHCKTTEHTDMNPIDFITDHLMNWDGIIDQHHDGDDQKSHQPTPIKGLTYTYFVSVSWLSLPQLCLTIYELKKGFFHLLRKTTVYISALDKPPIF